MEQQFTNISAFPYLFPFSHLIARSIFCNSLGCLWYTALKYLGGKIPSSFPGQRITLFADKKNLNPSANTYLISQERNIVAIAEKFRAQHDFTLRYLPPDWGSLNIQARKFSKRPSFIFDIFSLLLNSHLLFTTITYCSQNKRFYCNSEFWVSIKNNSTMLSTIFYPISEHNVFL